MAERVLLAGCGDLGMRVARRLLADGHEVLALRRHPDARCDADIRWIQADLTRAASLPPLPDDITQLVYLPAPGERSEAAYRAIFLDGLRHVLHALDAGMLRRVLFVSSTAVYGDHAGAWVDEETPPAPLGWNGQVLLDAERWLAAQPVDAIVLRLAGLYGPGRMQLAERIRGGQARAPRQPAHWANRIHVDDAAAAIVHLLALPAPRELYLGVDDMPRPLHELYDGLAALIGAPPVPDGPPPAGIGSKRLSNACLRDSGFRLQWPDALAGYRSLLA